MYIHKRRGWPNFTWDDQIIYPLITTTRIKQSNLTIKIESLGFNLSTEAQITALTIEAVKSNEIEGEFLDQEQVRSSIARHLGLEEVGLDKIDRTIEGVVEVLLDATQNFNNPLTQERLFSWHASLFPVGYSNINKLTVANWRKPEGGPMQVISGGMGRERVHFEAPDAELIPDEMQAFQTWFNKDEAEYGLDPVLKAAIAHFWFVTIHPFDDGNGRIARSITDMQLAKADGTKQRFYSMSAQIRKQRNSYYQILENSQKGDLDLTDWIVWFLNCLNSALFATEDLLHKVFNKAKYWRFLDDKSLNERQKLMLNKLLDGFEGKLNTSKWAKIAKTSQDSALRDIQNLINQGVLVKEEGGGRSTSYVLIKIQ
jgi:Fic family protein